MNNHTPNTVGIDISKAYLDAYELPSQRAARFANHASGFKRLAEWIGAPVQCVVYESTGPWHRALEEALADTYAGPREIPWEMRQEHAAASWENPTGGVQCRCRFGPM